MSTIDDAIKADDRYSRGFDQGSLAMPPARKLAIVACMDPRLTIEPMLGLKTGDAHIIRNAGGIVTEDVVRSLIISEQLLGTQEVMVINHTDCGMLTFKDDDLRTRLLNATGKFAVVPDGFMHSTMSSRTYGSKCRRCGRIHGFRSISRFVALCST